MHTRIIEVDKLGFSHDGAPGAPRSGSLFALSGYPKSHVNVINTDHVRRCRHRNPPVHPRRMGAAEACATATSPTLKPRPPALGFRVLNMSFLVFARACKNEFMRTRPTQGANRVEHRATPRNTPLEPAATAVVRRVWSNPICPTELPMSVRPQFLAPCTQRSPLTRQQDSRSDTSRLGNDGKP